MRRSMVLLVLVAAALPGCVYAGGLTRGPYSPPPIEQGAPDSGEVIYSRDCAWCHGDRGQGTARAPDIVTHPNGAAFTDFMLSSGRMPLDFPTQATVRSDPVYTPEEIDNIVEYVETLGTEGPGIPVIDPASADLAEGAALYNEHCAACHSTSGIGGALTTGKRRELSGAVAESSDIVAPSLRDTPPLQVAEAMLVGPGTMPVFAPDVFTDEEVDAIVRYVGYLHAPANPGGVEPIAGGPVMEGAVGWLIGLGALLVLSRWLGTKVGDKKAP